MDNRDYDLLVIIIVYYIPFLGLGSKQNRQNRRFYTFIFFFCPIIDDVVVEASKNSGKPISIYFIRRKVYTCMGPRRFFEFFGPYRHAGTIGIHTRRR